MSMMLRRQMMRQAGGDEWDYVILPEADGRLQKAKIPVYQGQHIHMEWDISRIDSTGGCVFSFFNQVNSFTNLNPVPVVQGGYPICWPNGEIGTNIYYVGHCDIDIPKDMNMFIGYWQDSDTLDRRVKSDWLKIRIT